MKRTCMTLALWMSLVACDGAEDDAPFADASTPTLPALPDATAAVEVDAGAPSDARADLPHAALIPLIAWVDDLIAHGTTESAAPDTVEDKQIMATEDPRLFDKYFE